ncbi:hypothetical protein [Amycolatopsis kentuckyensis]|uniref:hypothetical protein n=1 Tax=Amycolatopsis kentuckyensis TaxID=218823 RepID=UPI003569590B
MRFDDPSYVDAWGRAGVFPRIHQGIVQHVLTETEPVDGHVLDLGACTGLLGRQLADNGFTVFAVQEPGPAHDLGRGRGVFDPIPVLDLRVTPDTIGTLVAWIEQVDVRTVIARRVFPELWDALGGKAGFDQLAEGLADAGVERIFLEGRAVSSRTTHPLGDAAREVAALAPTWRGRVRGTLGTLERA